MLTLHTFFQFEQELKGKTIKFMDTISRRKYYFFRIDSCLSGQFTDDFYLSGDYVTEQGDIISWNVTISYNKDLNKKYYKFCEIVDDLELTLLMKLF